MSEPESDLKWETITLHELLERSARAALDLQREDGSFPPGRNGVYDEPETPVRTTSHWLTTLSKVYEITGDEVFAEAANDAADYLLSDEARPHGYTFHSRNAEGKDKCDGLIGQAAPIRGLARAGVVFDRGDLLEMAADVFLLHPFDDQIGLWERVEIDGGVLSFDRTLNHQLTFAAAGTELRSINASADDRLYRFLDSLDRNMECHANGLIKHYVRPSPLDAIRKTITTRRHWILLINEAAFHYYSRSISRRKTEIGYHPVNLSGLAHLKEAYSNHTFWESKLVDGATAFVTSDEYCGPGGVFDTASGSMLPGIETAYGLLILDDQDEITEWIMTDIEEHFDFDNDMFAKNTEDPISQATKVYNLTFLSEIGCNLIE